MRALPSLLLLLLLLAAPAPARAGEPAARPGAIEGAWLGPVALEDPADPLSLAAPDELLVLVYNHGSRAEFRRDRCRPRDGTTPPAIAGLAGREVAGLRIAVFAFCTASRLGRFDETTGRGEPKLLLRTAEIAALVRQLRAAGVPARRLVLAGQSAGGWAALLAAARAKAAPGGVIAFAPGFAGRAAGRPDSWRRLRQELAAELADAGAVPALIYAFEGDAFEPPEDLAFLGARAGTDLQVRSVGACGGAPHLGAFTDCFRAAEQARLLRFLETRVAPSSRGPSRGEARS